MSFHNLPLALTSFIGRDDEMREVRKLLGKTHLLTLTGAGGSGKTRLALAVAGFVVDQYQDGVWLVELAPLVDPALLPQAVASILGVRQAFDNSMAQTLNAYLKSKQLLLILDNCEHLIDASAYLAHDLITACPGLHILATSREPLHIAGEVTWLVPPLQLPNPNRPIALDELSHVEAVRLFVERARDALPSFTLTEQNALSVAQICFRLAGIPLAIELAAARIRVLSVEGIASRLDDVFQLLIGRDRLSPTRHQTLQATLDWSYDLLSEQEQFLFQLLSVFVGGFSLDAAETVYTQAEQQRMGHSLSGIREENILDLLAQLVEKSMVLVDRETVDEQRFRLLEPLRQYSWMKLQESGKADLARDRHLHYYLALVERAAPEIVGKRPKFWVERIEQELPNIRAAFDWSLEREERAPFAVRLATGVIMFWQQKGYFSEGLERLERILKCNSLTGAERARTYQNAGFLAEHLRDTKRAKDYLSKALELSQTLGDQIGIALQTYFLAWAALQEGEFETARRLGEACLAMHRETGDLGEMSSALLLLGDLSYLGGDISRARAYQEESLALSREAGNRLAVPRRFTRLGQIARLSGEHEHAALLFKESLALSWEGGDHWCIAMTLAGMAGLARANNQPERAVSLLGATQVFLESFGTQLWPLDRIEYETNLAGLRTQLSEQAFERAWSRGSAFETNNLDQIIQFAMSELEQFGIDAGSEEQQPGLPSQTALQAAKREFGGLTRREREVAVLIAQGKSNPEIAALLFVGRRTVEAHVTHILNKLGFRSRTQIAGWAVERGLAAPSKGLIELDQDSNF